MNRRQLIQCLLSLLGGGVITSAAGVSNKRTALIDTNENALISIPSQLFTQSRLLKGILGGKAYIGKIDSNPVMPENQIQIYIKNQDNSLSPVAQPLLIHKDGYLIYKGKMSTFVTKAEHSMAIYDTNNVQQLYFPNVVRYSPDILSAKLEAPDGYRFIGACNDISQLRTTEPRLDEQRINLMRYDSNVSTGGGTWWFDSSDITMADDGVYCVVTPNGNRWKRDVAVIDVADAGVSPTDFCHVKLQRFAACPFPKKTISFPFTVTDSLLFYPGDIDGNGNTITFTNGGFRCGKNTNLSLLAARLAVVTVKADNSITVDNTSEFAVGDDIVISNTVDYSYSLYRAFYKDGEFNTVVAIDHISKTITLLEAIRGIYPTAETSIYKLTKLPPLRLSSIEIFAPDTTLSAIEMIGLADISLRDVSAIGGRDAAIRFDRCFRVVGNDVRGRCTAEPGVTDIQYGLFIGNTQNLSISVGSFHGTRHGVAHGGQNSAGNVPARDCQYYNCAFSSRDFSSADTHGNSDTIKYRACRMSNGISVGGRDIEIDGCRISSGDRIAPVLFTEFSGGYLKFNNNRTVRMPSATRNAWISWNDTANAALIDMDFSIIAISNEIIGTAGTEFINFPIAVPTSIRWSIFIDGIQSRTSSLTKIVSLTKLARADGLSVADATTITVRGIDLGFDLSVITPVALRGNWSGSVTKFNIQGYSTTVNIDLAKGERLSTAMQHLNFFKYPSTPAISTQIVGNVFNGSSLISPVVTEANNTSCTIRLSCEKSKITTSATYRVLVSISFDGHYIS
ncbi:TPA: phage tailspike protein [Serratia fonticola]